MKFNAYAMQGVASYFFLFIYFTLGFWDKVLLCSLGLL